MLKLKTVRINVVLVVLLLVCVKNTKSATTSPPQQQLSASESHLTEDKIAAIKQIAIEFKDSLNTEVDPCYDYNEYICGHFTANKIMSKTEIATNEVFDDTDLKEILEKYLPTVENMNNPQRKLHTFLQSCINKKDRDLNAFIRNYNFPNSINGWPAYNPNWNAANFNLLSTIAEFELFANSILVNTVFKEKADGKFAIKISPKRLFVPEIEEIYKETIQMRRKMLENYDVIYAGQVINDVVLFEKEYTSAISWSTKDEPLIITYEELKEQVPEIDWDKYFDIIIGMELDDEIEVILDNKVGLKALFNKIEKMEPRVVVNYFFYLFVNRLNTEFRDKESCYRRLFLHFESAISQLVVKNLYTDEYMKYLLDMIHSVIDTIRISSLHDFNGEQTEDIMWKIENFLKNEYIPNLTDERINKLYENLQMFPDDFYGNTLQLFRYYMRLWLRSFIEGKNIGMKTINRRVVSYMFIRAAYEYYRKPSPILFNIIATPLVRKTLIMLAPDRDYDDSVKECFQRQLNISQSLTFGDIVSVKATEVYIRSFDKWSERNEDIIKAENEIFKEFGINVRKIVLAIHVQSSCRFREINDQSYLRKLFLSALPNMGGFAEEYNCPVGSPMNPKERCEIP